MKQYRVDVNKKNGFTLIELMIVVGIMGILITIAAPNFSKYQSKARQAEAKLKLSAIFAAEKAFYSEYDAYITSFNAIGFAVEGNKHFYTVGWGLNSTLSVTGYAGDLTGYALGTQGVPATWTNCDPTPVVNATGPTTRYDPQDILTVAVGQIRDQTGCDIWYIDHQKVLRNTQIGL